MPRQRPNVEIRRVQPADQAALSRFYAALSPQSRRARFLGAGSGIADGLAASFCTPDHLHAEGFVAIARDEAAGPAVVGHLCLEPCGERRMELALAVADRFQGRGIGRALFEAALDWASPRPLDAIVASAFVDNSRVLRLLSSSRYPARLKAADGGLVEVVVPLVPEVVAGGLFIMPRSASRLARSRRPKSVSPSRVVWRRRPRPAPAAEGSASRGSS